MPCKDTASKIMVRLDRKDCLLDFDFSKITCAKKIAGSTGYEDYCRGRRIDEIFRIEFAEILRYLGLEDEEDRFFLYLEWEALRTSIAQYLGLEKDIDKERYQISSITYDADRVEICQVIRPPREMPKKIVSCAMRAAGGEVNRDINAPGGHNPGKSPDPKPAPCR